MHYDHEHDREPGKNPTERLKNWVQDLLEALESLVAPQPEWVPVPVRPSPRPRSRR